MRVYREIMGTDNLPWEYDADTGCIDGRLRYVCDTGKKGSPVVLMNEDDAALAVYCVNNMPKVVEALGGLIDMWDGPPIDEWEKARNLLASLEAEKGGEL